MPYSGPSDESLPSNVKKMDEKKRAQWVHVFNSSIEAGDDESTAFAKANGVAKKEYFDVYSIYDRRLTADMAGYTPYGADKNGCANCNWYLSPETCVLLSDEVSPTGKCKYWMAEQVYTQPPIPVTIVNAELEQEISEAVKEDNVAAKVMSIIRKAFDKVSQAIGLDKTEIPTEDTKELKPLTFYKDAEGNLRFFTTFSNNFKDRQNEIIIERAHKDFVAWADSQKSYPELWLWHAGKESKWGVVDWLDYCDGFVTASGTVDKGKEYIAETLEGQDIGVSHGFVAHVNKNLIMAYRTFEISPLPLGSAANSWTNFSTEEIAMPFSDAKKKWLMETAKVPEDKITAWEQSLDSLSKELKSLGVDYKEVEETEVKDFSGDIASLVKSVSDLATVVAGLKGEVEAAKTEAANASKSLDDKVEEVFKAEIAKLPNGFRASESDKNKVDKKDTESDADNAWWGSIVQGVAK